MVVKGRVSMLKELINQFQYMMEAFQREAPRTQKQRSFSERTTYLSSTFEAKNGKTIKLEIANRSHIADVLTIEKLSYDGKTPWGYGALEKDIVRSNQSLYLVVYHNLKPIAFLGSRLQPQDIHITNIAVIPTWQNQGIGRLLLELLEAVAKAEKVDAISLEVRVSNEKAKQLYTNIGFKSLRVKKNYYHGDGEDAVDMRFYLRD